MIVPFAISSMVAAPGTRAGAPAPAASAPAASASAPGAATPTAAPAPPAATGRWLKGLQSLQTHMYTAMQAADGSVLTAASLRSQATQLRRCTRELAALGPPTAELQPAYGTAEQACADFERGASCAAAAAGIVDQPDPTVIASTKLAAMLVCNEDGLNKGSELISMAVADGSISQLTG